jgi:hypothetical protein
MDFSRDDGANHVKLIREGEILNINLFFISTRWLRRQARRMI